MNIIEKGGLLYDTTNKRYIDLPEADHIANACGHMYAERLVKALKNGATYINGVYTPPPGEK